jgi:hypothetical protein
VDSFAYANYANKSAVTSGRLGGETIIDSGTIYIAVPEDVVDLYAKLFNPPAISPPEVGIYITECDAQGPEQPFSVTINGTNFDIPGADFVLSGVILSDNGLTGRYGNYCYCGIQSGGFWEESAYILGRPFLENLVAVHDLGAKEMRFALREY